MNLLLQDKRRCSIFPGLNLYALVVFLQLVYGKEDLNYWNEKYNSKLLNPYDMEDLIKGI